jgi:hypothetical protein
MNSLECAKLDEGKCAYALHALPKQEWLEFNQSGNVRVSSRFDHNAHYSVPNRRP